MNNLEEDQKKEYWSALAIKHSPGIGQRTAARLLRKYGSAFNAYRARKSWKADGFNQRYATAILEETWREDALKEWRLAHELGAIILLWTDSLYPVRLKELCDAPLFLYCLGDLELLRSPAIAIVGSRNASEHAIETANYMSKTLSACGLTIISGMAKGIDAAAHIAALERPGKSIGVLGTGIDQVYPRANKGLFEIMSHNGLLVSEFTPGTAPLASNFPVRNRIISGLSLGVLVVEAASQSGTLITARLALEQNRDVFAVPGRALDTRCYGCHQLIRQGARPVFSAEDILYDLSEQLKTFGICNKVMPPDEIDIQGTITSELRGDNCDKADMAYNGTGQDVEKHIRQSSFFTEKPDMNNLPIEEKLLRYLSFNGPTCVDIIVNNLGIEPQVVNVQLLLLEMSGKIRRLPGSRYEAMP